MPNTYTELRQTVVGTATPSVTLSLSGISGYTDLVLVIQAKTTDANSSRLNAQYNSDTGNNYSYTQLTGNGSTASSARIANFSILDFGAYPSTSNTRQAQGTMHIMNYSNTSVNKTTLSRFDDAGAETTARVGLWRNTAAITSISMSFGAGNIAVGSTFSLYGIANADQGAAKATGGIITEDSQYWYHTFGASGTFTPKQALTCDYLVVAGGGGGAGQISQGVGGGGAGGLRSTVTATGGGGSLESAISVASGTPIAVTVGAGGLGCADTGTTTPGNNSVFSTITSTGGGGGETDYGTVVKNGGSGGGAKNNAFTPGTGASNQGFAGGNGATGAGVAATRAGGGGGGAGGVGAAGVLGTSGGNGGTGCAISITGTSVNYGGGGGGGSGSGGGIGTFGGGTARISANGTAGTTNTGGGGGASYNATGGNGGSGVVIIRYSK